MQVALTALSLFSNVVAPSAIDTSAPDILWTSSWEVMCSIATAFATEATRAHVSVRQRFMQTLAAMHVEGRGHISDAAYEGLLSLLAALAAHPVAGGEMWPPTYIPPLQTTLAACLPDFLPPQDNTRRWAMLLEWLCGQLLIRPPRPHTPEPVEAPLELELPVETQAGPDQGAEGSAITEGEEEARAEDGEVNADDAPERAGESAADAAVEAAVEAGPPVEGTDGDASPPEPAKGVLMPVQREVLGLDSEELVRKLWAKTVAEAAVGIMKGHMPWEVRGQGLRLLAAAFRGGIALRWAASTEGDGKAGAAVPQAFVQSFVALVQHGLPGVHYTAEKAGAAATEVCCAVRAVRCAIAQVRGHRCVLMRPSALRAACTAAAVCIATPDHAVPGSHMRSTQRMHSTRSRHQLTTRGPLPQAVWLEVCETFNLILHPPREGAAGSRCRHDFAWEPIEEAVLDSLASTVLSSTSHIPGRIRRDLVAMVAEGCSVDTPAAIATGGRLVFLCLRKLCVLCGRGAGGDSDRGTPVATLDSPGLGAPCHLLTAAFRLRALPSRVRGTADVSMAYATVSHACLSCAHA